jgi:hypothetical protein
MGFYTKHEVLLSGKKVRNVASVLGPLSSTTKAVLEPKLPAMVPVHDDDVKRLEAAWKTKENDPGPAYWLEMERRRVASVASIEKRRGSFANFMGRFL